MAFRSHVVGTYELDSVVRLLAMIGASGTVSPTRSTLYSRA